MTGSIYLLATTVLFFFASASPLTTSEAVKHVGENATVCGTVAGVHTATSYEFYRSTSHSAE